MTSPAALLASEEGCYEAARAAALSGVPLSTVYHWARTGLVVPSVSPSREMLWSYADLMTLRLVAWLRRAKHRSDDQSVRASPMGQVRDALKIVADRNVDPWTGAEMPSIVVDGRGAVLIEDGSRFTDLRGQAMLELPEESLDLLRPFKLEHEPGGPDLVRPRPMLRIVPSKVAGEPHVQDTRITSRTLSALVRRGVPRSTISEWYDLSPGAIAQATDLEEQLARPRVAA